MVSPPPFGGLEAHLVAGRGSFRLDLRLAIAPGETVALLGPNGAGKTTALHCLAGLLPLAGGHITLGGRVLDDPARRVFVPPEERRFGVVFQDYLLFPHLTAAENVAFGPRSRGRPPREARRLAMEWLGRFGLEDLADFPVRRLSGGQAQQVALARALASDPDCLLLDEPLAALDVTTRARLRRSLAAHLATHPGPRLLITHSPTGAALLADRIVVLEEGRATQEGTPDDIRRRPRTPYAADLAGSNLFVGTASGTEAAVGTHLLQIADPVAAGPVLLTIHPTAITVHRRQPEGSPRNTWPTTIQWIEHLGHRARLRTGPPLPLTVEVTEEATAVLHLAPGDDVWVAVKAAQIGVEAEGGTGPEGTGPEGE